MTLRVITSRRKSFVQHALQQYLRGLPDEKSKAKNFFTQFCDESKPLKPDEINRILQASVVERWAKPSTTRGILSTVAAAQKELDGVVNSISRSLWLVHSRVFLTPSNSATRPYTCVEHSMVLYWYSCNR